MNLGLFDILTAQQVGKPDLRRSDNVSNRSEYVDGDIKFKDYVDNDKKANSDNYVRDDKRASDYRANNNITNDDDTQNALLALTQANLGSGKIQSNISEEDLLNILKSLKDNNIDLSNIDFSDGTAVGQIISQLKSLDTNGTITDISKLVQTQGNNQNVGDSILNNLLYLQEAEGLQTQIIPPGQIIEDFGQAISSISNEIAKNGLQTSTTPEIQSNLVQSPTNTQSLSGIENTVEGQVAKVAEGIIETAKINAEEPQILPTDVKSNQIESLLGLKTDNKQKQNNVSINQSNSKNTDILQNLTADDIQTTEELAQKLQNQLDDQKIAAGKSGQSVTQTQGTSLQSNLSQNNDSNSFRNSSEFFTPSSVQNSGDTQPASGEFTKFQKYVDTISNNIKDMGALKAGKANDVLAQIKFGISSLGAKGESKITIQLHPKELGSVDVRMETGSDGKTKVAIMAEKIDTLNLLQKEAGSLKGLLTDALQTQSSDLSFSFHEQSDEKWKEIIQEAFGNSHSQGDEEKDTKVSVSQAYNSNMVMTEGLDITV